MALFDFFSKTSYTFEGKKEDEEVALFLHRHWFTLVNKMVSICLCSLIPFIFILVFGRFILPYLAMVVFLWSAFILVLWFVMFYTITMYTLDYWIVTNERIVDSEQNGFFNRKVSELSLSTVQDVSTSLVGFIPTTMNYGAVIIQTAARENHFYFDQVPSPQAVKDTIMNLIDQIEDRKEGYNRSPRTEVTRL
jgi:Bacterial PH domain